MFFKILYGITFLSFFPSPTLTPTHTHTMSLNLNYG